MVQNKQYYTPTEVAEIFMVSPITVRQWAYHGKLKSHTTVGGHRRFMPHDLEMFARTNGLNFNVKKTGDRRILLVDDDRQFVSLVTDLIQSETPDVVIDCAYDGFTAGRLIQSCRPDIVLLDLIMPGLDGFSVCEQIKSDPDTSSIRVIAVSGRMTKANRKKITAAGAEACLVKPLDMSAFLELLQLHQSQ